MRPARWLIANLIVASPAALAWYLDARHAELYYRIVQEDHWLEWATVWAFLLAAAAAAWAAHHQWWRHRRVPWFVLGLGLFCVFVAGEEISWGQRLLGFTPPEYFLTDNFQQELNLHNVVASDLRQLAFQLIVLGYGVALPLAAAIPATGRLLSKLAIVAPHPALMPAFAATAAFYAAYPLEYAGEWAELMLGLGMLTAIAANAQELGGGAGNAGAAIALGGAVLTAALGFGTLRATTLLHGDPGKLRRAAETELRALAADFTHERVRTRCGVHKRVYTFRVEWGQSYLSEGRFANLTTDGLDATRARYFLDPWGLPYWVRHECAGDEEVSFVYSFGPNRRRDSAPREIRGDDIGVLVQGNR
ncbi:hypothetical protein [Lentisalinibacter sediminis]|uniref:hypothetical protein n=1 Tax=Lentisalinibacter sediminis TaxID=2992237 RepID=UPI00386DE109